MIRAAVAGNPVSHSLSPIIFNGISNIIKADSHYTRIVGNSFKEIIELSELLKIDALNITSPFKSEAFNFSTGHDKYSEITKTSNFLLINDNKKFGYNTDFIAFCKIIENEEINIETNFLILGAGDTAFLVFSVLKQMGYHKVSFAVRDKINCKNEFIKQNGILLNISELKSLKSFKIIINTVPEINLDLNLFNENPNLTIIDAIYKNPFLNNVNANYISGYKWLIMQAIPAIKQLYNIETDVNSIEEILNANTIKKKKIVLTGFMGSGKSTIGKELAKIMLLKHSDSDEIIEKQENTPIHRIFREKCEDYFRNLESSTIKNLILSDSDIISIGGGALENKDLAEFVYNNCFVIYLYCQPEVLKNRIINSDIERPLFNKNNFLELYNSREENYFRYSDLIINNSNGLDNILNLLSNEIRNSITD
jgi:shikimate dehydrogenase